MDNPDYDSASVEPNDPVAKFLEYGRDSQTFRRRTVLLWVLPAVASFLTILFRTYWRMEPFAWFRIQDALILVGCPILVTALWIAWLVLAVRRPRVSWFILVPMLCWAAFTVMKSKESIAWYLQEGWTENRDVDETKRRLRI